MFLRNERVAMWSNIMPTIYSELAQEYTLVEIGH
jgi:hypothetical protein